MRIFVGCIVFSPKDRAGLILGIAYLQIRGSVLDIILTVFQNKFLDCRRTNTIGVNGEGVLFSALGILLVVDLNPFMKFALYAECQNHFVSIISELDILLKIESVVLWAGSNFDGLPGKDCELF